MLKNIKRLTAVVLSLALVLAGTALFPNTAKAANAIIDWEDHTIASGGWTYNFNPNTVSAATYTGGTTLADGPTFNVSKNDGNSDDMWIKSPAYTVPTAGSYTVKLTVTDQHTTDCCCWSVIVNGQTAYTTWNADPWSWPNTTNEGTPTVLTYTDDFNQGDTVSVHFGQTWASAGTKAFKLTISPIVESDDLDITGYQMSATSDETVGKIGFRTVYQFEPTVESKAISERGLVYALKKQNGSETGITPDDVYVGNPSQYVHPEAATAAGELDYQAGSSSTADYYAMTMQNSTTVTAALYQAEYYVRAYVKTSDNSYYYSPAYKYTYYDVADYLYQHNLFSNQLTHTTIYTNVLHAITPSYQAIDYDWGNIVVKP